MRILHSLRLLFRYGSEIEKLLKVQEQEEKDRIREGSRYNLKLCVKHRQEVNKSHYSEKNCDHCKLLEELKELRCKVEKQYKWRL